MGGVQARLPGRRPVSRACAGLPIRMIRVPFIARRTYETPDFRSTDRCRFAIHLRRRDGSQRCPNTLSSPGASGDMITGMNILAVLLALVLFAVVAILLFGIIAMARGGEFNRKYGNKMMRWRVAIQALAVVLVLLFVFVASVGGK